jgi:uncharacterized protein YndB with AHSA1/START domain
MTDTKESRARAVADLAAGSILATVEIAAPPARVFVALASEEIVDWWVRDGFFRMTEWTGDVRPGGRWRGAGVRGNGAPFVLEGEFLEVDPPRRLVHTWFLIGAPGKPTTVSYLLEPIAGGTRVTLRHEGLATRESSSSTMLGWETSFERLAEALAGQA